jgi:hypothetical protein
MRAPKLYRKLKSTTMPDAHPLFRIVPGKIKNWEKGNVPDDLLRIVSRLQGFDSSGVKQDPKRLLDVF